MRERIYLSSPHMGDQEIKFIQDAFDSNWISPAGPNISSFEKELGEYLNVPHVAALSSGTAALHLALINLKVGPEDEVICSSFTFAASSNPIVYLGARPVFIDCEEDTWNMDPELLETAIKARMEQGIKPKAIIIVHLYGMPAKMDEIMNIADKYQIPVIEDAAEAIGSSYNNRPLGTFGEMSVLSFNGNKIITTSGGGALLSANQQYIDHARFLATQARDQAPHYQHSYIGYNYRMSNICAGIGRGQLMVLPDRITRRRENFQFYYDRLDPINGIEFLLEPVGYFSNRWLCCILVDPLKTGTSREEIRLELETLNIETRPLWKPMHLQPIFKDYMVFTNGVSDRLFEIGLCLPSGSNLHEKDLESVVEVIINMTTKG